MSNRYAVISMAFVRLPDLRQQGPYWIGEGWPSTDILWDVLEDMLAPYLGDPPIAPGVWIHRFKFKLDGARTRVLWARWKEATAEESMELMRVIESEQ